MSRTKVVALVWAPFEGRTASFSQWLKSPIYNVHFLKYRHPIYAPFKYPLQWLKTWFLLMRARPNFVYVCDSPPIAGLCVYTYCLFTRTRYVMDTHTPNLLAKKWGWTRPLQRFLARRAVMNVVDQDKVKEIFDSWDVPVMVLESPPKEIPQEWIQPTNQDEVEFAYVGSLAADEPVEILIEAAKHFPEYKFYIMGDTSLAKQEWLENAPDNAIFTGFILKENYWGRLSRARGIICLTLFDYSLMAGAQDAIDIDKPVILSDQPPMRLHFSKGAVFVDNTADGMRKAIVEFLENETRLNEEIRELRQETSERWQRNFKQLNDIVNA